jgi:predicted nucleic acid-binding protein
MRVFLDTNVLVYLFDNDSPAKQRTAQGLLARHNDDLELTLSTQVLQEFYVATTRKLAVPLSPQAAERAVRNFSRLSVVTADPELVLSAIERAGQNAFSFWDALIVEAALRAGAQRLMTEDMQHGRQIGRVRIENPFERS